MIFSDKNMTPFDGELMKGIEEGLIIADGEKPKLITKNITANDTYNSSSDNADGYNKVIVNVANSYTAGDEGKVVSGGALIAQTAYPTEITENDTYDTTNYNSITVNVSGGGGGVGGSDVIFYDYDGTVVTSYSAADFANLSAMPANPTHTGLTAQGWNWSLADAKAYVANHGKLNVGQMYITSDGKTRFYVILPTDDLYATFQVTLNENTELDIDWGDGDHTTWTSDDGEDSKSHEYVSAGRYVVTVTVISGSIILGYESEESRPMNYIYRIEIGSGVTALYDGTFNNCMYLSCITIPNSVTSIGRYVFTNCGALSSITIPSSVTNIGDSAFYECYGLSSIMIPNSVTNIGDSAFYECYALSSITIPNSVTSIGDNILRNCYALSSITIPNSVTSIGDNALSNCYALSSITILNSVTSIGDNAFYACSALSSITIPDSVTSIGRGAFEGQYALLSVTFTSTTPPEISSDLNLLTTCIIRVPQGSLSAYTSAQYYPDPTQYIYEEY